MKKLSLKEMEKELRNLILQRAKKEYIKNKRTIHLILDSQSMKGLIKDTKSLIVGYERGKR